MNGLWSGRRRCCISVIILRALDYLKVRISNDSFTVFVIIYLAAPPQHKEGDIFFSQE